MKNHQHKFIKKKKDDPHGKSPSNPRIIPEKQSNTASLLSSFLLNEWKFVVVSFVSGILLVSIGFAAHNLSQTLGELAKWQHTKHHLVSEMSYWQGVVAQYPEYRDAWFKLSLVSYQLGERDQAAAYMQKVFALDPNYEQGRVFVEQTGL